jgi:NhaP-type Na+/H+ or K+/H+ antiporter
MPFPRRIHQAAGLRVMVAGLVLLAALFVAYSLVASRLDRLSVTGPIVLVLTGIAAGPAGFDLLHLSVGEEPVRTFAELTLALLLFTDASTVTVRDAEEDAVYPARLLAIGLPLTIALGAVAAILLFPDLGLPVAAVVATILAPTDAALGLPLVTNPIIPARVRRVLNVESGLNDGIATPFLTLFLAVAVSAEGVGESHWAVGAAVGIGLAVLVAILVGGVGGWLLSRARVHGFASELSSELAIVALPVLAYGASVIVGGNGFVAAFGAGLAFRATSGGRFAEETEFGESLGTFGSFLVWVLFGAVLAGPVLAHGVHPQTIVYAVLSLTVVRMLPVAISLLRSGFRPDTIALIGWFGPRGLASVVFTLLAFSTLEPAGLSADAIVEIASVTVLLSVVAHGLTAVPLAPQYRLCDTASSIVC